jgi:NTE family protein
VPIDTSGIAIDPNSGLGYRRAEPLQHTFLAASESLRHDDGWPNPANADQPELVADLALEGGGVKGIALVGAVLVLSEAGYRFRGVAGTSAGAIAATLIASITKAGQPMLKLKEYMDTMEFSKFMPEGRVHSFLDHEGGKAGSLVADAAILSRRMGLYSGDYLEEWLSPKLTELGVTKFGDLRLPGDDPQQSLANGHDYRLVVHTSDVTRAQLVRLPWDYPYYGWAPDDMAVVEAVRASMSIPFFFDPVTFTAQSTDVDVPTPGSGTVPQHYEAGTVTWVDGGMLRNFPIDAFDRDDGSPPRWPTIGIKLSSLQTQFPPTESCEHTVALGVRCLRTMMNEWDSYSVGAATAGRTIFIDNGGLSATDFNLTPNQQNMLFLNGVKAATAFVIEMAAARHVPRTGDEGDALARGV